MKNIVFSFKLILFVLTILPTRSYCQNVVITDTTYNGDSSAVLDVFSFNKGLLVPRLSEAQRDSIYQPATSLLIYQTNNRKGFYYFNGNEWQSIIEKGFKVYPNYDSLRNDTAFNGTHCFVQNFSYLYQFKNYETFGGYFVRQDTGSENGGTILMRKDSTYWHRDWDQIHIQPEWWEVGGYDEAGLKYSGNFTSEGIQHDGDRLNAVCNIQGGAKVIELKPGYTYEHRQNAFTLEKGEVLNGNGATIKRQKCSSPLAAPATQGSTVLTVQNAGDFRIGDKILAFSGNGYGQQSHSTPSYSHTITSINGNTLTITPGVSKTVQNGVVQAISDQVIIVEDVAINNTTFDGNTQEMNATNSWTHMACIISYKKGIHISNCKFLNMPSDVIICASELWVNDAYIENLYGAFVHGSSGLASGFESAGFYLNNVKGRDICKVPSSVNGHSASYGFYTQSIKTNNVTIEGCYIENGNYGGIISPLTGSSDNFSVTNNYFKDFDHIMTNISTSGIRHLRISNNDFYNCGVLNFEASINSSTTYSHVNISDNVMTNCQMVLYGVNKLTLSSNQLSLHGLPNFTNFVGSKKTFSNSSPGLICLSASNAQITDNTLVTDYFDNRAYVGIYLATRNNNSFKNCKIDNNQVIGFLVGIYTILNGNQVYRENLTISNNIIELKNYTAYNATYGIQSGYGTRIINNYIKHSAYAPAIKVFGTTNQNAAISNVVTSNFIEGPPYARQIELVYYKNIVNNNTLTGGIGFLHPSYATKNLVGINYQYNMSNNQINPVRNTAIKQLTGNGVPTMIAANGSTYIDKISGEMYLRISNAWKKIVVQ